MTHNERTARFAQISTALALQSDQELTRLVDGAEQLASGIGGTTLAFELGGHKVFAKRLRLTDLDATASVMIFREYLPWNLSAWLDQQLAAGPAAMESACTMVERGLTDDIPSMNSLGLMHGDAHFGNILTDGHRLHFADLGLATLLAGGAKALISQLRRSRFSSMTSTSSRCQRATGWLQAVAHLWGP
jgi:hypothetical protein